MCIRDRLNTTPANVHEVNQLEPLVNDLEQGTRVEADKGYSSAKNRKRLQALGLEDGIMQKAHRGSVLTREPVSYTHLDVYKRQALELANYPDDIRGYGHINEKSVKAMEQKRETLLKQLISGRNLAA